jgi:hypothetical protein
MDDYKAKPDYSLLAQALSREPGLSGARYLETGQNLTDATLKGKGFFGEIPVNQGGAMTEFSSAYDQNGKMVSHPLLVPTLNKQEIDWLKSGQEPTPQIIKKAQDYAQKRMGSGQSTFATPQELRYSVPTE